MSVRYWHGGMPGLRVGDLIEPGHERATRDDCPICDARRVGTSLAAGRTKPITKCLKKRILTRDGNRCVECGSTKWLEIAHIEPYRVGGNNADDNLRTLCNPCHQAEGRNAVLSH